MLFKWAKTAIIFIVSLTYTFFPAITSVHPPTDTYLFIDKDKLESGDLIFRRGLSFVSQMVLMADNRSPFSHVGIIYKNNKDAFVIHAVPDESEDGNDIVKLDPINEFLKINRAVEYAVYRIKNSNPLTTKANAVKIALEYANKKIPFDSKFDLEDSNELYCTELVWKSYKGAGLDLIDNNFDHLIVPMGSDKYILPGSLINSPHLTQITLNSNYSED